MRLPISRALDAILATAASCWNLLEASRRLANLFCASASLAVARRLTVAT